VVLELNSRKAKLNLGRVEVETAKKPTSNRSTKERRNTLFRVLDGVLSLSHKKIIQAATVFGRYFGSITI
jgi:hypothetical protein